jgi:predicted 3-demethylubiquinone-9 3-methyltransferase (glyoxalase superfamily)
MQKISPFLWFDTQAEEAVDFYLSVFKEGKKHRVTYYNNAVPGRAGQVLTVNFELFGQNYVALNGGPQYTFTPAISLFVRCKGQQEVDELWDKLTEGGKPGQCGWLEDKFGLSWQIAPEEMFELIGSPDPRAAQRVMEAMFPMRKIVIADLQAAAARKD